MKRLLASLLIAISVLGSSKGNATPACAVDVQPKIAIIPVRGLKIRVTIEPPAGSVARLELNGPEGFVTSTELRTDVRTQWIDWKQLVLDTPGEYEVWLGVSNGCIAKGRVVASGE